MKPGVPPRFVAFSIVGSLGVAVHFAVLSFLLRVAGMDFLPAQAIAALLTMSFNFAVNNALTYRDRRLKRARWLRGWVSFNFACSIGGCINVGLAACLYKLTGSWYSSALAGIAAGAVWNYSVTKRLTWNRAEDG
jgi:dolichol-phosphate mannosyltransferase